MNGKIRFLSESSLGLRKSGRAADSEGYDKAAQINSSRVRNAIRTDHFMTGVFYAVAGFFLLLLIFFAGYVIIKGLTESKGYMYSFSAQGIGNQFFNTVYLVFLSLVISVPIGIMAGIYMAEYAREGKVTKFLRICIETLSSLPSIVVGLFGYLVFILTTHSQWNLFSGALAVAILSLPLIATTTEDAFRALPPDYKRASLGMGATHRQAIVTVLLPAAAPRIISGVVLAAGRGFGEAAALLYTAGMSTDLNWTNWNITSPTCPLNPFRPGETLALHIWAMRTEALSPDAAEIANLSSAVLMIMVLAFSLLAHRIEAGIRKKQGNAN